MKAKAKRRLPSNLEIAAAFLQLHVANPKLATAFLRYTHAAVLWERAKRREPQITGKWLSRAAARSIARAALRKVPPAAKGG